MTNTRTELQETRIPLLNLGKTIREINAKTNKPLVRGGNNETGRIYSKILSPSSHGALIRDAYVQLKKHELLYYHVRFKFEN